MSVLVSKLQLVGLASQAMDAMSSGMLLSTDYSGFDFPKEAIRVAVAALEKAEGKCNPEIKFVRACDWGEVQQRVLKKQSEVIDGSACCVFKSINDRLPAIATQWIMQQGEVKSMSKAAAAAANEEIATWLDKNSSWVFESEATSECLVHHQQCWAYPGMALHRKLTAKHDPTYMDPPQPLRVAASAGADEIHGDSKRRRLTREPSSEIGTKGLPWWERLDLSSDADGKFEAPLVFNVAGFTCVDWTCLGSQRREGGDSQKFYLTWQAERKRLAKLGLEDGSFSECSTTFPVQQQQVPPLSETHEVVSLHICSSQLGFPVRRGRMMSSGLNRQTMIWVGPTNQHDLELQFLEFFAQTCELSGDVFFQADPAEVHKWVKNRVSKRKAALPHGFSSMPMSEYLHCLV